MEGGGRGLRGVHTAVLSHYHNKVRFTQSLFLYAKLERKGSMQRIFMSPFLKKAGFLVRLWDRFGEECKEQHQDKVVENPKNDDDL